MAVEFTESDIKILTGAWLSIEGDAAGTFPKLDYDKLAEHSGFTKGSAQKMWGNVKKKLIAAAEGGQVEGLGEKKQKAEKTTPKKRAAPAGNADGTPKKRGRKSKAEMAAAKGEGDDDEEVKAKTKVKSEEGEDEGAEKIKKETGGPGLVGPDSEDEV